MARDHRAIVCGYGARLALHASDEVLLGDVLAPLPRGWSVSDTDPGEWCFSVRREADGIVTTDGAGAERTWADVAGVRSALREELRRYVGFHAPDLLFFHAGTVAYRGSVIVLPGQSFAGKSTLVRALVGAGAEFYSDEYAIIDRAGQVIQYREPMVLRGSDGRQETNLIAEGPDRPLPVGLVGITSYREGAAWAPRNATVADGIVAMMEHASRARPRAAEVIATLRLALENAKVLVGERGDADETAAALLDAVGSGRPSEVGG